MNYLEKYGYTPDRDAIGRAIEMIAANMENIATEQVYKDCFSMMDLTTLKTDDTPASVTKLVEKVNVFHNTFPEWPYPASVCVFSNFASTVKNVRKGDFNITVVSACFPSSQSFLEVKLKEVEMAVEQGADEVDIVLALNAFLADDYDAASEEIRQVRRVIDETAGKQGRTGHQQGEQTGYGTKQRFTCVHNRSPLKNLVVPSAQMVSFVHIITQKTGIVKHKFRFFI